MDRKNPGENIDKFSETKAAARTDGTPNWDPRELASQYVDSGQKRGRFDVPFFVITLLLLTIGVIMVLSASYAREYYASGEPTRLFTRQLIFAISGIAIMLIVSRISVRAMSRFSMMLLVISIVLLVLVLMVGVRVNGSKRWLSVGGSNSVFRFQPSEIAKLALILAFAQMICRFGRGRMRTFKYGVVPFAGIALAVVALLMMETHLSASIIVTVLAVILMFAGGTRLRWFILAGVLAVSAIGLALFIFVRAPAGGGSDAQGIKEQMGQINWGDKLGYTGQRIDAWLNPESDPLGDGFQIRQSLFAVGSGGLLGQGFGQSRQKYLYLPEEHNDYIFAIVCEELGYIGAMMILLLFALLIIRGFWLALHAKDKYSSLVITGITSLLAIQVFLSVAVVTNLLPSTGIALPFFSYGGTALWLQLVQVGIVLSISRDIPAVSGRGKQVSET